MKKCFEENFPGALTGPAAARRYIDPLLKRGFSTENTLYADSSCPDEINHDDETEDLPGLFHRFWGSIFPLSGLAGVPFAGKTGWAAFSGHCPEDGNICVLFAPHVGMHTNGNIGQVMREGQSSISLACGAAIGALTALKEDETCADFPNGYQDY